MKMLRGRTIRTSNYRQMGNAEEKCSSQRRALHLVSPVIYIQGTLYELYEKAVFIIEQNTHKHTHTHKPPPPPPTTTTQ